METTELLRKVRRIEIKTRKLTNNVFSGEYHSHFKGRGMSFSEVREYQYGDDIRAIDWNVTARFKKPYIKVFEEERELTVMLMVDISGSEFFGSVKQFKKEIITEICAIIAFSAIQNNDKVGVLFFSDKVEKYIPPKKGRFHILRIIRELLDFEPVQHGTDITGALRYLVNVMKKKAIVFMLSDFMNTGYKDALSIASKKHDFTGIRIYDKREATLPNMGMLRAVDAETGMVRWVNTASQKTRKYYSDWYQKNVNEFSSSFMKTGADQLSMSTDEDYIRILLKYFKKRA